MRWQDFLTQRDIFTSKHFYRHRGVYVYQGEKPEECPVCGIRNGRCHAHGSFLRWLKTWTNGKIKKVLIRKPRYLCLSGGHTFSLHPPEGLPHKAVCNFMIVIVLWSYLNSTAGMHHSLPGQLSEDISVRTASRYLQAAKDVSLYTQQFIRQVLIEKKEPRPVEDLFAGGLDPPEELLHKQRKEPEKATTLWRALKMLLEGAKNLQIDPNTLLARANQNSRKNHRRFLL